MEDGKQRLADQESGEPGNCVNEPGEQPQTSLYKCFNGFTLVAVNLSLFAFLPLQVPQIVKNAMAKSDAELAGLAWQGTATGALGNLLLLTFFTGLREWGAARAQFVGTVTNAVVVAQIYWAGYCPAVPFWTFVVIECVGIFIPLAKIVRLFPKNVYNFWQEDISTAIGGAALVSLVASTFAPTSDLVLYVAALAGLVLVVLALALPATRPRVKKLSGWLATYLFMWMPMPQIITNFTDHEKAASFSIGFAILATLGNGLNTSRALFTKNAVWFTGSIWGTIFGGFVTAVSVCSAGYLNFWVLIGYSIGLLLYLAAVFQLNKLAHVESFVKQLAFLWSS